VNNNSAALLMCTILDQDDFGWMRQVLQAGSAKEILLRLDRFVDL
jgi:hypothetical protein